MKKLLIIIFLAASFIYAQKSSKGNISFNFNGKEINLPIHSITLMKQDNIVVTARAEHNDQNIQQMVSLELGFKKLAPGDKSMSPLFRIDINLRDNANHTGNDLSIQYDNKGISGGNGKNETAHYGVFNKGERVSWDINSLHMVFNVTNVVYSNKELKISGTFTGTFGSTIAPKGQIADIKDGKFEIII